MTEIKRVSVRDIDFAYLEAGPGDGPLALCLHGFPDHAPTWNALLGDLAGAGYHAVAPWTRGYSPTSLAPDGNYETANLALDAVALAEELAPGRSDCVLIGHDWGAISGYVTVTHAPDRFARLVTMAVPHSSALLQHFLESPRQLHASFYVHLFQTPIAEYAASANDYAFIDYLWSYWSPGYTPDPAYLRALKDSFAAPGCLDAAISYYRFMTGTLPGDPALAEVGQLAAVPTPVPTLYLHGADDACLLPEMVQRDELEPLFPQGLELEIVPGTGHFLHLEDPETVNRRVVEFLTG